MMRLHWMLPLCAAALVLTACGGADNAAGGGSQVTARMFERERAVADTALCATHAAGATSAVAYRQDGDDCLMAFTGGADDKVAAAKRPTLRAAKAVDANAFMNWAQQVFKPFFPDNASTTTVTGLAFRFYPSSGNYIGVADDGSVFILGPVSGNQLAYVGKLADFSCAVYPENCAGPQVSGITSVNALSYSQAATLLVNGSNLDQGVSVSAPGCTGLAEQAGGSATQRRFSCTVNSATQLAVTAKDGGGNTLLAANLPVPDPQVTMATNFGSMVVELYPAKAPITVNNFLKYTKDGFYSGTVFHRVISNFVIQGGGYLPNLSEKAVNAPIKLESNNGLSNVRGTIAMARTNVLDSATSQFYFNVVDNSSCLDYGKVICDPSGNGYAVFGKIVDGLLVMDTIKVQPTTYVSASFTNVPIANGLANVVIQSVTQTR